MVERAQVLALPSVLGQQLWHYSRKVAKNPATVTLHLGDMPHQPSLLALRKQEASKMASNLPTDVAGPLKTAKQTNFFAASPCLMTPAPLPWKQSKAAWHTALYHADVFNA